MISSIEWIPAGIADPNPKKYELSSTEQELIEMIDENGNFVTNNNNNDNSDTAAKNADSSNDDFDKRDTEMQLQQQQQSRYHTTGGRFLY